MTKYQEAAERIERTVETMVRRDPAPEGWTVTVAFGPEAGVVADIATLMEPEAPARAGDCKVSEFTGLWVTVDSRLYRVKWDKAIRSPEIRAVVVAL